MRVLKKVVGKFTQETDISIKNTGNKPVAHSSIQHTITEGAPEPMVSKAMVPSPWSPQSSGGDRQ